ncbi:MAG: hypothetical protein JW742_04890, partial [Candidatus Aminicenantes bacterium]|nr:hypothetical protein [Candidatus Aminicenantes bacterium]
RAHRDAPADRDAFETRFIAFLEGEATPAGKMAVCRELRSVGTERSVPALAGLLTAPETSDAARYALEKIPGAAADKALIDALHTTSEAVRLGVISSLANRGSRAAVSELAEIVLKGDGSSVPAAATALGAVGGPDASKSLYNFLGITSGEVKSCVASSLLLCAEEFLRAGDPAAAAPLFDRILKSRLPEPIRRAAFKGTVRAAGGAAEDSLLAALTGRDAGLRETALAMVPEVFGPDAIGRVTELYPNLSPSEKIRLVSLLTGYPKQTALPVLIAAAAAGDASVRVEALKALEASGDASAVGLLVERTARSRGAEQLAARTSLWGMKGDDVDRAVLALAAEASDLAIRAAAVRAVGERSIAAGKDALLGLVRSGPPTLRLEAIRGLKGLAGPADLAALLALLVKLEDEAEIEEMRSLAAGVALTIVRPGARADAVESMLATTTDAKARGSLLRVLGQIGDESGLPLIRRALSAGNSGLIDAAVRAVCDWPTAAARDDALAIARTGADPVHRVLALQAFVRMVGLEPYRNPAAATADLATALALASRPEEKKLVLGLLPRFACPEARALAESLLADPAVKDEAALAAARIKERLGA